MLWAFSCLSESQQELSGFSSTLVLKILSVWYICNCPMYRQPSIKSSGSMLFDIPNVFPSCKLGQSCEAYDIAWNLKWILCCLVCLGTCRLDPASKGFHRSYFLHVCGAAWSTLNIKCLSLALSQTCSDIRGYLCRNIDKAGGLDRYLWKIEGTNEDTKKAEQLRQQLRDHEENKRLEQWVTLAHLSDSILAWLCSHNFQFESYHCRVILILNLPGFKFQSQNLTKTPPLTQKQRDRQSAAVKTTQTITFKNNISTKISA